MVAESEEYKAEDIVPSQIDIENEQDAQNDRATDFDATSNEAGIEEKRNKGVKRLKKQKQYTTPTGQLVEILKESSDSRKHQYEGKKIHQTASKQANVLETLDDIDLFFLTMLKITKKLPKLEQCEIKLALSNSVLSAEIKCNRQFSSPTSYPCSIQPQSHASSSSSALNQNNSSGEYPTVSAKDKTDKKN